MNMAAKRGAVVFRRIGGRVIPILKNVAIGAVAGGLTGRVVSDSLGGEHSQKVGTRIGAAVGLIASIPPRPVGRAILHFASRYKMGYKASKAAESAAKMKK